MIVASRSRFVVTSHRRALLSIGGHEIAFLVLSRRGEAGHVSIATAVIEVAYIRL